jgi:UDP-2,3-diacylglucosamine pyrophosphatase LpxH
MNIQTPRRKYRAIWISDIHICTRQCRSDLLLDFLRWHDCDTLYLVGDIIDGWSLRKNWFWRDIDNELVQRILQRANTGTEVV